ncbi:MAG TPA: DUF3341 domain-containing protein [Planctomycetota bacterium]|nr:DUF3341 domain-containing protein [Planctomycetota bacterium]
MTTTKPAAFGVYHDRAALERGLQEFKKEGIPPEDISIVMPHKADDDAPTSIEGAEIGAGAGALFGGVLGWLIGAGMLAVPGLGALVIAGPIGTAIAGSVSMGGIGGIVGSFIGLGCTDEAARHYEERLKLGHPILSVQCDGPECSRLAETVFKRTGAENVYSPEFNSFTNPQ